MPEITPLPDGTRVHHAAEEYPRARRFGTAVITGHFYIGDHLEYNVRRDNDVRDVQWAYYHARKSEEQ